MAYVYQSKPLHWLHLVFIPAWPMVSWPALSAETGAGFSDGRRDMLKAQGRALYEHAEATAFMCIRYVWAQLIFRLVFGICIWMVIVMLGTEALYGGVSLQLGWQQREIFIWSQHTMPEQSRAPRTNHVTFAVCVCVCARAWQWKKSLIFFGAISSLVSVSIPGWPLH